MTKLWRKYILWFAQEHVDFRISEFESIVKMFGIQFRPVTEQTLVSPKITFFLFKTNHV